MENLSNIEDVILSAYVFSERYKVEKNSQNSKNFASAYLDLASLSEHSNALGNFEFGYCNEEDKSNKIDEKVSIENIINDYANYNEENYNEINAYHAHQNSKNASNDSIFIHHPSYLQSSFEKETICKFEDECFHRTRVYGGQVMEYSTARSIKTSETNTMTRHVTVFYSGDGISKPIIQERFKPEDRELWIDGVKQASKSEENKTLMEEMLYDIDALNSIEMEKKAEEEKKKKREESMKMLELLEEMEK